MKHLLAGLILSGLGIWGIVSWWDVFGLVMRGVIPFGLLMVGLVAILASFRNVPQEIRTQHPITNDIHASGGNGTSETSQSQGFGI